MEITKDNLQFYKNMIGDLINDIREFEAQQAAPVDDWPMSIWDLPKHNGFFTLDTGSVRDYDSGGEIDESDFATEKDAKSALAFAQLSRLIRHVNKGWEPDWSDPLQRKYFVQYKQDINNLSWYMSEITHGRPNCLFFKNEDDAQRSIETWRQLWLDYFQADEQ